MRRKTNQQFIQNFDDGEVWNQRWDAEHKAKKKYLYSIILNHDHQELNYNFDPYHLECSLHKYSHSSSGGMYSDWYVVLRSIAHSLASWYELAEQGHDGKKYPKPDASNTLVMGPPCVSWFELVVNNPYVQSATEQLADYRQLERAKREEEEQDKNISYVSSDMPIATECIKPRQLAFGI
jgi:hypothetical protein